MENELYWLCGWPSSNLMMLEMWLLGVITIELKEIQEGKNITKAYIVYMTKLLSMVNTRGLNC